ncbi:serine hydrolase domain-containing protein [Corallincola spongiicola]|uniref:Class A beta-lactamase-related serine hydrolase n=1 Tax=Corallincola spongiicola TaxID=2520508 RepID=A0ABY1WPG5_9GAMM|nr:serine hydrolase domain-containing protein [Corallincola spongiicola]TAA45838.1 class A beta-lactamase-related serine hydrolase [Corallincola spongiicola]
MAFRALLSAFFFTFSIGLSGCGHSSKTTVTHKPAQPTVQPSGSVPEQLQQQLDSFAEAFAVPGMAVAIVTDDDNYRLHYGEYRTGQAVTADSQFAIGSVSKIYLSALVLMAVDSGLLRLDGALIDWLPDIEALSHGQVSGAISIRQLLQHSSGLGELDDQVAGLLLAGVSPQQQHQFQWSPEQLLATISSPVSLPGQQWHYANSNYLLLGIILERIYEMPLATLMQQQLWVPLALTQTWQVEGSEMPKALADAWLDMDRLGLPGDGSDALDNAGQQALAIYAAQAWGAGAMVSTATETAQFVRAVIENGLLSDAMVSELQTTFDGTNYGLGVVMGEFLHGEYTSRIIGHGGRLPGYRSVAAYLPELGVAVAILTNADNLETLGPQPNALAGLMDRLVVTYLQAGEQGIE